MRSTQKFLTKYSVILNEKEHRTTCGIRAVCTKTGETLFQQDDICPDLPALTDLARRLEESDVYPIHLPGIIEDFLDEYYG